MTRNLLLSAAAVACLALPAVTLADPPSDQSTASDKDHRGDAQDNGQGQGGKGRSHGQSDQTGRGAAVSAGAAARNTSAVAPKPESTPAPRERAFGRQNWNAPASGQVQGGAMVPSGQRNRAYQPGTPNNAPAQAGSASARFQTTQPQFSQPGFQQRQSRVGHAIQPPVNQSAPTARWYPGVTGQAREQAGQQWRQANAGWVARAPWHSNRYWWRDNDAFRGFSGVRFGFFFVPEFGYVSAPAEYRERHWRAGEDLPSWFWRFAVRDYWSYGLPRPPDDCEWVWVNDDVVLIDVSDGYILDVEYNVW